MMETYDLFGQLDTNISTTKFHSKDRKWRNLTNFVGPILYYQEFFNYPVFKKNLENVDRKYKMDIR